MTYREVTIDTTRTALERLGRASILTGARVVSGLSLRSPEQWGRGVSAVLLVEWPDEDSVVGWIMMMGRSVIDIRVPAEVRP